MNILHLTNQRMSRRTMLKAALLTAALPAAGLITLPAEAAAALVPLNPTDPQAKALGFTADASKVDAKANTTYKPGQKCGTCAQFQGKPGEARAGCNIFPGKSVSENSWCKVWAAKPAKPA